MALASDRHTRFGGTVPAMTEPLDLTRRTVLVLGAGASKPYGFPLGNELKTLLITHLEVLSPALTAQEAIGQLFPLKNGPRS